MVKQKRNRVYAWTSRLLGLAGVAGWTWDGQKGIYVNNGNKADN